MTAEQSKRVKRVLTDARIILVMVALSYVNLTDDELNVLILRHLRGHTQCRVAEDLDKELSTIQRWEKAALEKCCFAWKKNAFIQYMINTQDGEKLQ